MFSPIYQYSNPIITDYGVGFHFVAPQEALTKLSKTIEIPNEKSDSFTKLRWRSVRGVINMD